MILAFYPHDNDQGGPASFVDQAALSNVIAATFHMAQTLVGDAFLFYRVVVVWGCDRRIVIVPLLLLIGSLGTFVV